MRRDNIEFFEYTPIIDLIEKDGECVGAVILTPEKEVKIVSAKYVVLASGGIGGLFKHSTNFKHLTGDALAICLEHGVELKNISYIQIHPTTLYSQEPNRRKFLISESVRGEGAKLYGKDMQRFTNELLPRDLLTKEIYKQMQKDGTEFVWEDLRPIPKKELREHFPNIVNHCHEFDYDVSKECIPVVPAQHYFMGGIKVNYESRTNMPYLRAVGETACNGVHGKNRLASNSLLESLVFAKRAAHDIINCPTDRKELPSVDFSKYNDIVTLKEKRKARVLEEIEKEREQNV
jgi:L-aspartate oxidase